MNLVKNVTHFVYVVWFNFFCLYPFYFAVLCCLKMYHKKKHQIKLDKYSEQLIHQCKYKIGQHKNESMFSIIITGINNLLHLTDIFFLQIEYLCQICKEQIHWCHFSYSIFALCISLSHFVNSHNISNFFIIIIFFYGD